MADKKKVFVSWSGNVAKAVARVWHALIQETFDNVEPFMSEENIGAGARGLDKIAAELAGSTFGVIVVTQENQYSQWLNYEAGALSKDLGDDTVRVAPSLVDFEKKNDIVGPMSGFQANLLTKEGVQAILSEIAKTVDADQTTVVKRFSRAWEDEYAQKFEAAKKNSQPPKKSARKPDEVLDEILTIVRDLARDNARNDPFFDITKQLPSRLPTSMNTLRTIESEAINQENLRISQNVYQYANEVGLSVVTIGRTINGNWSVVLTPTPYPTPKQLNDLQAYLRQELGLSVRISVESSVEVPLSFSDQDIERNSIPDE